MVGQWREGRGGSFGCVAQINDFRSTVGQNRRSGRKKNLIRVLARLAVVLRIVGLRNKMTALSVATCRRRKWEQPSILLAPGWHLGPLPGGRPVRTLAYQRCLRQAALSTTWPEMRLCLICHLGSRHVSGQLSSPWCRSIPQTVERQSLGHPSSKRNRLCSTPCLLASPFVPVSCPALGLPLRPSAGLSLARVSPSQPTPIPAIARSGATDQGSAHPDCNTARLRYDIEENSQRQEPEGPRG